MIPSYLQLYVCTLLCSFLCMIDNGLKDANLIMEWATCSHANMPEWRTRKRLEMYAMH